MWRKDAAMETLSDQYKVPREADVLYLQCEDYGKTVFRDRRDIFDEA